MLWEAQTLQGITLEVNVMLECGAIILVRLLLRPVRRNLRDCRSLPRIYGF